VRESGEVILGFREDWIQQETWQKISERKWTKEKINLTRSGQGGEENGQERQDGLHVCQKSSLESRSGYGRARTEYSIYHREDTQSWIKQWKHGCQG